MSFIFPSHFIAFYMHDIEKEGKERGREIYTKQGGKIGKKDGRDGRKEYFTLFCYIILYVFVSPTMWHLCGISFLLNINGIFI